MRRAVHILYGLLIVAVPLAPLGAAAPDCTNQLRATPRACCGLVCQCARASSCVRAPRSEPAPQTQSPALPAAPKAPTPSAASLVMPPAWVAPLAGTAPRADLAGTLAITPRRAPRLLDLLGVLLV